MDWSLCIVQLLWVGRWGLAAGDWPLPMSRSLLVSRCELVSYCGLITMGWSVAVGRSLQDLRKNFFFGKDGCVGTRREIITFRH